MEEAAGIHHLPQPGAVPGCTLDRQKQREKLVPAGGSRVLAKRLAEREMLRGTVSRKTMRVGREEGEGSLVVPAVFGKVEMDAPDDVPGRVECLEVFLQGGLRFGLLGREGRPHLRPQGSKDIDREVLGAGHGWSRGCQRFQVVGRRGGFARAAPRLGPGA